MSASPLKLSKTPFAELNTLSKSNETFSGTGPFKGLYFVIFVHIFSMSHFKKFKIDLANCKISLVKLITDPSRFDIGPKAALTKLVICAINCPKKFPMKFSTKQVAPLRILLTKEPSALAISPSRF